MPDLMLKLCVSLNLAGSLGIAKAFQAPGLRASSRARCGAISKIASPSRPASTSTWLKARLIFRCARAGHVLRVNRVRGAASIRLSSGVRSGSRRARRWRRGVGVGPPHARGDVPVLGIGASVSDANKSITTPLQTEPRALPQRPWALRGLSSPVEAAEEAAARSAYCVNGRATRTTRPNLAAATPTKPTSR